MRLHPKSPAAAAALCAICLGASAPVGAPPSNTVLRVCAEPNNLPFSNTRKEGFENKLAELIAHDLGKQVVFVWTMERENFIDKTLNANLCDLVMGIPAGFDAIEVTQPYYTSSYVFVYRKQRFTALRSIKDPRLKTLRIGVHLIGDDSTPPAEVLAREGIVTNVAGFMIYGDTSKPNPPARLIEAVASGAIDVAAVWGPIGGYFARQASVPLAVSPIEDTQDFAPLQFRFSIAMGVRRGNRALRDAVDQVLAGRTGNIRNILTSYGVPLVADNERRPRRLK